MYVEERGRVMGRKTIGACNLLRAVSIW